MLLLSHSLSLFLGSLHAHRCTAVVHHMRNCTCAFHTHHQNVFVRLCSFIRCICGLLKNKCRILVTHQLQHLRADDHIVLLQEVRQISTKKWFGLRRCLTSLSLRVKSRLRAPTGSFSARASTSCPRWGVTRSRINTLKQLTWINSRYTARRPIVPTVPTVHSAASCFQTAVWLKNLPYAQSLCEFLHVTKAWWLSPCTSTVGVWWLKCKFTTTDEFLFFSSQKQSFRCQRRLAQRETLVAIFTWSTSLQAVTFWF